MGWLVGCWVGGWWVGGHVRDQNVSQYLTAITHKIGPLFEEVLEGVETV